MSQLEQAAMDLAAVMKSTVEKLQDYYTFHFAYAGYSVAGSLWDRAFFFELMKHGEMTIECNCDTSLRFSMVPNGFLKWLNIFDEPRIKTNNKDFDDKIIARSIKKRDMKTWLDDHNRRDSIIALTPMDHLEFQGRVLEYETSIQVDNITEAQIMDKAKIMHKLAGSLEAAYFKKEETRL